jgi:hypothetical protein
MRYPSPPEQENGSYSRFDAATRNLTHFCEKVVPSLSGNWMRHSLALDHLEAFYTLRLEDDAAFGCGPAAFASIAGLPPEEVGQYFPSFEGRAWTNRRAMERALDSFGWRYSRVPGTWPQLGLCLVHWRGPWTKGGYPAAILLRTHWVAVVGEYVFDVNWRGWLPRENWEDLVVSDLIVQHNKADGWEPLTAYEIFV